MAKIGLYQVYDDKAGTVSGPIMAARRAGPAIRDFTNLLRTRDTQAALHPQDFRLVLVGEQDDETGVIQPVDPIQTVLSGATWMEQTTNTENDGQ